MAGKLPKKKDAVEARKLGNECLLYDQAEGKVHHMNSTAAFIWEKCDECSTKEELLAELKRGYSNEDIECLEQDMNSTLECFLDLRLMEAQG